MRCSGCGTHIPSDQVDLGALRASCGACGAVSPVQPGRALPAAPAIAPAAKDTIVATTADLCILRERDGLLIRHDRGATHHLSAVTDLLFFVFMGYVALTFETAPAAARVMACGLSLCFFWIAAGGASAGTLVEIGRTSVRVRRRRYFRPPRLEAEYPLEHIIEISCEQHGPRDGRERPFGVFVRLQDGRSVALAACMRSEHDAMLAAHQLRAELGLSDRPGGDAPPAPEPGYLYVEEQGGLRRISARGALKDQPLVSLLWMATGAVGAAFFWPMAMQQRPWGAVIYAIGGVVWAAVMARSTRALLQARAGRTPALELGPAGVLPWGSKPGTTLRWDDIAGVAVVPGSTPSSCHHSVDATLLDGRRVVLCATLDRHIDAEFVHQEVEHARRRFAAPGGGPYRSPALQDGAS